MRKNKLMRGSALLLAVATAATLGAAPLPVHASVQETQQTEQVENSEKEELPEEDNGDTEDDTAEDDAVKDDVTEDETAGEDSSEDSTEEDSTEEDSTVEDNTEDNDTAEDNTEDDSVAGGDTEEDSSEEPSEDGSVEDGEQPDENENGDLEEGDGEEVTDPDIELPDEAVPEIPETENGEQEKVPPVVEEQEELEIPQNLKWDAGNRTLTWDEVEGAEKYLIQVQVEDTQGSTEIMDTESYKSSFTYDKGLIAGYSYKFLVASVSGEDVSEYAVSEVYKVPVTLPRFEPVSNPRWGNTPGWARWDAYDGDQEEAPIGVRLLIYKDGKEISPLNVKEYTEGIGLNHVMSEYGDGIYTFQAAWYFDSPDSGGVLITWSEMSNEYRYTEPENKAELPSEFHWNSDGSISWTPVSKENMPGYTLEIQYTYTLYNKGEKISSYTPGPGTHTATAHMKNMVLGESYTFTIHTNGEGVNYGNSPESSKSEEFKLEANEATAGSKLDSLFQADADSVKEAVENVDLQPAERDMMTSLLQRNTESASQFKQLEEKYREKANKSVSINAEGAAISSDQISVAGAALNGASALTLAPAETTDTTLTGYQNITSMNISLDQDTLKFPVLITMPAPEGMNANRVSIYHYHDDNTRERIVPRVITENGTRKLEFAVNDFSLFTFVESKASSGGGGSSSGGSGGSSRIITTSYDLPGSAAEITGTWIKNDTGWWLEKADKSYPKNQWAKINGATYRFNEAGYMVEGWLFLNNKWYYLTPASGAMATGWVKAADKWYYLNADGTMATGWIQLADKWYYLGTDGAMLSNTVTPDQYKVDENGVWVQ